jgi:transcriptional regulator with XRE-family HTH domain
MEAADLLRLARRRRGLSQATLAVRAGVSRAEISAYEQGRRDPTTATLRSLIAATGERLDLRLASTSAVPAIPRATSSAEHGARLLDLLLLADAIPAPDRPRPPLAFPRIDSR